MEFRCAIGIAGGAEETRALRGVLTNFGRRVSYFASGLSIMEISGDKFSLSFRSYSMYSVISSKENVTDTEYTCPE